MSPSSISLQKNLKQHDVNFCSSLLRFFIMSMVFYSFLALLLMSRCHFWCKKWHAFLCKSLFESWKSVSRKRWRRGLSLDGKELVQTVVLSFKLAHECVNLTPVSVESVCRARISLSLSLCFSFKKHQKIQRIAHKNVYYSLYTSSWDSIDNIDPLI